MRTECGAITGGWVQEHLCTSCWEGDARSHIVSTPETGS
jgi:hypothetical protein